MILSKFRLIIINRSVDLQERVEYVHMKGLGDKGHVELAISKPKGKVLGYFSQIRIISKAPDVRRPQVNLDTV